MQSIMFLKLLTVVALTAFDGKLFHLVATLSLNEHYVYSQEQKKIDICTLVIASLEVRQN